VRTVSKKIFAVIKHEYRKIVLKWSFLIGTFLLPLMGILLSLVPVLVFSIKVEPMRLVIADPTGKIKSKFEKALNKSNSEGFSDLEDESTESTQERREKRTPVADFILVDYSTDEKDEEQIQRELKAKISNGEIDAYIIIPRNFMDTSAKFELYSRRAEDVLLNSVINGALNRAVRAERLSKTNISEDELMSLMSKVNFSVKKINNEGEEKEGGSYFGVGFFIALLIYITLSIYGQTILSAVVEEKETRIAEILFSSAKPIELMIGKLIGVGLACLTQLAIWLFSALSILLFSLPYLLAKGFQIPQMSPAAVILYLLYFLIGFFTYASVFALIGSAVTNMQEGGQFSLVPVSLMLVSFYLCLVVIRDPNSTISIGISVLPFSAPLAMPIRIIAETPPVWQIGLSIIVNVAAVFGIIWLSSRIYRVGMLMYGKRPTLPELFRWIRES
jgi:ABC-2 type transport system permease protein